MNKRLDGKRALVTGATRGIGRAIADRLVAEGADVIATGTKAGGPAPEGCDYIAVDFADAEATQRFAEKMGDISPDILINNAGINRISPFTEIDPEEFALIQRVNLTAPFLISRAVVTGMAERGWGRIVNISSIWGKIAKEHRASYAASKFALDGMTAALSAEFARRGILANCVAPGFINTEMTRSVLSDDAISKLVEQVPARRMGTPEEIAAFVVWLAGPENTYITGQNIAIDGGFTRV